MFGKMNEERFTYDKHRDAKALFSHDKFKALLIPR